MNATALDPFHEPGSHLALEVFRLNGALIAFGDALVAPLGLTSARWQVLGAVAQGEGALPVAQLARNMGLARQSVQRVVDELAAAGILAFAENPNHKRAKLVRLTGRGETLFAEAARLWAPMASTLAEVFSPEALHEAARFLSRARETLAAHSPENMP